MTKSTHLSRDLHPHDQQSEQKIKLKRGARGAEGWSRLNGLEWRGSVRSGLCAPEAAPRAWGAPAPVTDSGGPTPPLRLCPLQRPAAACLHVGFVTPLFAFLHRYTGTVLQMDRNSNVKKDVFSVTVLLPSPQRSFLPNEHSGLQVSEGSPSPCHQGPPGFLEKGQGHGTFVPRSGATTAAELPLPRPSGHHSRWARAGGDGGSGSRRCSTAPALGASASLRQVPCETLPRSSLPASAQKIRFLLRALVGKEQGLPLPRPQPILLRPPAHPPPLSSSPSPSRRPPHPLTCLTPLPSLQATGAKAHLCKHQAARAADPRPRRGLGTAG